VLPTYPDDLSKRAEEQLRALGVEVMTSTTVLECGGNAAALATKTGRSTVETHTILWAAGVQASPLARTLNIPLDRAGRVVVKNDLTIPGHDEVFVIGDLAAVTQDNGTLVPGVAPAAIQEGVHTAHNIARAIEGKPPLPFRYRDKGSLATIGRAAGVAEIGKLHLSGFIAWFAWLAIHIFFLIGFRNRLLVIVQWAWAYVTLQRGARLITGRGGT